MVVEVWRVAKIKKVKYLKNDRCRIIKIDKEALF